MWEIKEAYPYNNTIADKNIPLIDNKGKNTKYPLIMMFEVYNIYKIKHKYGLIGITYITI